MSHKVDVQINSKLIDKLLENNDIMSLLKAAQKAGLKVAKKASHDKWHVFDNAEYVIEDGKSTIGIFKEGGKYTLQYEAGYDINNLIQKLKQRIITDRAIAVAKRQGYEVVEEVQNDGTIKLKLRR